ncbi:hypothetical protein P3T39_004247 [Kitasatospora sp. GP82]|nr:hypothetical protein [Kitasatospora sp. GP82]
MPPYRDRVVARHNLRLHVALVQDFVDDGRLRERPDVWGSESHRCWSSCVSVLVDDATEDAGAQESVAFEVVNGGGLLVGAG